MNRKTKNGLVLANKLMMKNNSLPEYALFRHIIEGLTGAVLMFGERLTLEYINPAGEMLLQSSAKRLLGLPIKDLLAEQTGLPELAQRAIDSNNSFNEREVSLPIHLHDSITVDCALTPIVDITLGKGLLVELSHVDHTLRISREVNQLNQNLAVKGLISDLAHEIKNPLGGLRGAAQLLERELPNAELKEYTDIIIGEADRLRNLVNQLLGPNVIPQHSAINIHQVTEHVRRLILAERPDNVVINTDYDPSIPEITGDKEQLIQAFFNVLANAAQAIEFDGRITLVTRSLRQYFIGQTRHRLVCRVDIIDNGPGIADDMLEKIFFPMVTTRAEGTGLGLSIAQSLIQQHRGIIQCKSSPGETIFSILLPIENR